MTLFSFGKPTFIMAFTLMLTTSCDSVKNQSSSNRIELISTIVADSLNTPWELVWGPDNWIWLTQRNGYVNRLNPETGELKTILRIKDSFEFTSSGTLGMVLHPEFDEQPYVYLVYTYMKMDDSQSGILQKCVRYEYDEKKDTLVDPFNIIHDMYTGAATGTFGSRLAIDSDGKLLMTTGWGVRHESLREFDKDHGGRILRFNLDGTIPDDNPYPGDPTFTIGHRNPQGLALSEDGVIYVSEHGPHIGDEINIIKPGRDYGWPYVCGNCNGDWDWDGKPERLYCLTNNTVEPIKDWSPSIAPSNIAYYNDSVFSGWHHSLILLTLKMQDLRVLKLSEAGDQIISETTYLNGEIGRLRDHCFSPDGRLFISTSKSDVDEIDVASPKRNVSQIFCIEPKGASVP